MNNPRSIKNTFWHGALLLSIAGIVTKLLSAVYRVPYQNIAGDIGFYIYQQVYPFIGIAIALSIYGFPVMISKMIAETDVKKKQEQIPTILALSFMTIFLFSGSIFVLLFVFSKTIASYMGDVQLQYPIRMAALTFLILPFITILRGFYQGYEQMQPTAISQIAEQFIRVSTILVVAYVLTINSFSPYEVGTGAIFGSVTGGFAAIAVLLLFKKRVAPNIYFRFFSYFSIQKMKEFPFKELLFNSITICMTGLTLVLIQLVDAFTLYSLLIQSGTDDQIAKTIKGVFDRGQPLIQLGVVLATSLSLSIVPAIAKATSNVDPSLLVKKIKLVLKINFMIGIGATSGLVAIMKYTNIMLFTDAKGTEALTIMAFSILFISITLTNSAILQGLGYITYPAIAVIIGIMIKWILNLVFIPSWGINGAAISTLMSVVVITIITSLVLYKRLNYRRIIEHTNYAKIIGIGVLMYLFLKGYEVVFFHFFVESGSRLLGTIFAISSVFIGATLFFLLTFILKIFDKKEFAQLPIGKKEYKKLI
jgi:polysaccharide transporter, PST family